MSNLVLPYNRIAIIAFAVIVLGGVALLIAQHAARPVRARRHAEPAHGRRASASTRRGSTCSRSRSAPASPGSAGCALSQIGNVGPDLGQSYIVDSFMVVVLGGVGQLAGTVVAALGLGVLNKFLEGMAGAVLAKIMVLVFIVIFIQKRPAGPVRDEGPERGGMSAVLPTPARRRAVVPPRSGDAARHPRLGRRDDRARPCVAVLVPIAQPARARRQRLPPQRLRGAADRQDHVLRDRARWRWT